MLPKPKAKNTDGSVPSKRQSSRMRIKALTPTQIKLLEISSSIANNRYAPETSGEFNNVIKDKMYFTPANIKAVYDELISLFNL